MLRPRRGDRWALGLIQRRTAPSPLGFRLWDGFEIRPADVSPIGTFVIKNRRAHLLTVGCGIPISISTAVFGAIEIRGVCGDTRGGLSRAGDSEAASMVALAVDERQARGARQRHHHYDLGNEFYRPSGSTKMVYVRIFPTRISLDDAQRAKLDLVCQSSRCGRRAGSAGTGCGWGSLAVHGGLVASPSGPSPVDRAIACSARASEAEGLRRLAEFVEATTATCTASDIVVSVGMLEHVGKADYPAAP